MAKEEKKTKSSRARKLAQDLRAEAADKFSTLITSAFGLVAAFAWNEVVKGAISRYIEPGQGLKSELIYALFVTALAILVSLQLGRLAAKYKSESESEEE